MSAKQKRNKILLKNISHRNSHIHQQHAKLFPEEYDCMYDSISEAQARQRGINPMRESYQREVNLRRLKLGVEPYMGNIGVEEIDISKLITSFEYCKQVVHAKKTNE